MKFQKSTKKEWYGMFLYSVEGEEPLCNYYSDPKIAVREAKKWSKDLEGEQYIEVWKRDKNGNYGDSGTPLYKSDEVA
jgi:hypothetical protein